MVDVAGNPDGQGSPVPGRYKISVRGSRAYLAGVGTSGSLLAGAAVLFLIGSAIVAFNGWPQIGAGPATSNIAAAPLAASSRASRRLTVVLAATRQRALTHVGAAGTRVRHPVTHRRTAVQGVGTGSVQPGSTGSAQPTGASGPATSGPGGSPAATATQCGSCDGQKPPPEIVSTDKVVHTVSSVGDQVGQQITNLAGAVGQQLGTVSQQAGNAVSSAGATVGSTVSGTVNTATNAVSGLTGALGVGGR